MKTQGTGYLGYRTAITPDGDWQFFVAGDYARSTSRAGRRGRTRGA